MSIPIWALACFAVMYKQPKEKEKVEKRFSLPIWVAVSATLAFAVITLIVVNAHVALH